MGVVEFVILYNDLLCRFGFPLLPGSGRKADGEVGVVTNDQITGGVRCCKRRTTENKHSFGSNNGSEVVYPPRKIDRKSTRLNSSHVSISYAVFCLKKE